jgi:hypothetical protein
MPIGFTLAFHDIFITPGCLRTVFFSMDHGSVQNNMLNQINENLLHE